MTEKERATEFLRQHRISGADFTYTTGFDNMVGLLEAYAAQQKSEIPTDDRIMQYVTSRFSDSHLKPELIAFRAIKYCMAGFPPVSDNVCVLDVQQSKMPTEEDIVKQADARLTDRITGFVHSDKRDGFIRCGRWMLKLSGFATK